MEQGDFDRLSSLPTEVLLDILSRLPLQAAARTSVLSKLFMRMWLSRPQLSLSPFDLLRVPSEVMDIGTEARWLQGLKSILLSLEKWVSLTTRPIKAFTIQIPVGGMEIVSRIIVLLCDNKLQQIEIRKEKDCFSIPNELFVCSTLRSISLHNCELGPPKVSGFSGLHSLKLDNCILSDDVLRRILEECHSLTLLHLFKCRGMTTVTVLSTVAVFGFQNVSSVPYAICIKERTTTITASFLISLTNEYHLLKLLESFSMVRSLFFKITHEYTFCLCKNERVEIPWSLPSEQIMLNLTSMVLILSLADSMSVNILWLLLNSAPNLDSLVIKDEDLKKGPEVQSEYWAVERRRLLRTRLSRLRVLLRSKERFYNAAVFGFVKFLVETQPTIEQCFIEYLVQAGSLDQPSRIPFIKANPNGHASFMPVGSLCLNKH